MAAPLGCVLEKAKLRGVVGKLENLSPRVAEVLNRNGFLSSSTVDTRGTTIRYQRFSTTDAVKFALYTEENLVRQNMPAMSQQVLAGVLGGLDELFSNAALHSNTECGVFSCGQAFPAIKRLRFSIADAGIGIGQTVARKTRQRLTDTEAIDIAMQEGFTSKALDVPGGLGLKVLKEFVKLNGGNLIVVSGRGYWSMTNDDIVKRNLIFPFPGTAVTVEINTADDGMYFMDDEINPDDIF
jgi:hypothetical protein